MAIGVAGGLVASLLGAPEGSHLLIGWDLGAATYLAIVWRLFLTEGEAQVRARAEVEDESRGLILTIVLSLIAASLVAIVVAMISAKDAAAGERATVAGLACVTLVVS